MHYSTFFEWKVVITKSDNGKHIIITVLVFKIKFTSVSKIEYKKIALLCPLNEVSQTKVISLSSDL